MSNTTQSTCRNFPYTFNGHAWDYVSAIATLVTLFNCSLVSAVGNIAVCYVFYSTRQLWQRRHIFTINLTVLNLLTALLAIPTYIIFLLSFINGKAWCKLGDLSFAAHRFCFSMTVVNVSLISYQRFFSVLYPYRYQALLTQTWHTVFAIGSWLYGVILTVPFAAEIKILWPGLKELCFASKTILLVHIATTTFCYGKMGYIALRHRRGISPNSRQLERLCKTKKTSLHLIGTLLVSTFPWLGLSFVSKYPIFVEFITYALFYTSSFLNLFIYALRSEDIEAVVQRKVKRKLIKTQARSTVHPQFQQKSTIH